MPARPKYQVFISSTYSDLREEREAVTWAILKDRHIPVGMENLTAMDDRGWKAIKSLIDRTDYYVLIVAGRYGSVDVSSGKSWTEQEYDYAREIGIPVLAFVREDQCITKAKMEREPAGQESLRRFVEKIGKHHYAKWHQSDDLVAAVSAALRQQIDTDIDSGKERPGWYRGDELPSPQTLEEFARLSTENDKLRAAVAETSLVTELRNSLDKAVIVETYQAGYAGARNVWKGILVECNSNFITIKVDGDKKSFSTRDMSLTKSHNPDMLVIQARLS